MSACAPISTALQTCLSACQPGSHASHGRLALGSHASHHRFTPWLTPIPPPPRRLRSTFSASVYAQRVEQTTNMRRMDTLKKMGVRGIVSSRRRTSATGRDAIRPAGHAVSLVSWWRGKGEQTMLHRRRSNPQVQRVRPVGHTATLVSFWKKTTTEQSVKVAPRTCRRGTDSPGSRLQQAFENEHGRNADAAAAADPPP
jgi:hypothetical protein